MAILKRVDSEVKVMKYPEHPTETKPVTGEQAKQLLKAIDSGGSVTNDKARATIQRILQRQRKRMGGVDGSQKEKIREG